MPAASKIEAAEQLTSSELSEESFAEGGEYLPLGVWAKRGFDVTRIEQHTRDDDKRICPVLGICFRLRILSKTNVHKRGILRESKRQKTAPEDQVASASAAAAGSAAAPLALEDGRASSSSDSSDSSSSDSSDSRRRKRSKKAWKQAKKSKKDDKKDKKSKKSNKEKKNKKSKKNDKEDKNKEKEMSAAEKRRWSVRARSTSRQPTS
jgi:type IV secretory pathway VirB10-like protein